MKYEIHSLSDAHAADASAVVQESFLGLSAADWRPAARSAFLKSTAPASLQNKLGTMTFAAGAFCVDGIAGVLLMPSPRLLGLVFVRPGWVRLGIGEALWESARVHIEAKFPDVSTIEVNSTPSAVGFYNSAGFERDGHRAVRMACWLPARAPGAKVL
jgi:GNAT superfamily N-acetyltransferase